MKPSTWSIQPSAQLSFRSSTVVVLPFSALSRQINEFPILNFSRLDNMIRWCTTLLVSKWLIQKIWRSNTQWMIPRRHKSGFTSTVWENGTLHLRTVYRGMNRQSMSLGQPVACSYPDAGSQLLRLLNWMVQQFSWDKNFLKNIKVCHITRRIMCPQLYIYSPTNVAWRLTCNVLWLHFDFTLIYTHVQGHFYPKLQRR